jgi:leader peptidase (prepilin peptidase)/N-methyltransferase
MLDAVADIPFAYVLSGIIWAITLGFAVGNYACSLVHRLPRGRLLLDKPPYCGHCGTPLATRDLFPVFSALLLRHRCRYCREPFPVSHTWTELLVGLLFVLTFLQHGFSEAYVLIVALGVFFITLSAIHANEGRILPSMLAAVVIVGFMLRILQDHSLFAAFEGGLFTLLAVAALMHRQIKKEGHIYVLPPLGQLLVVAGVCVGSGGLLAFVALYVPLAVFFWQAGRARGRAYPSSVAVGLAATLVVLYPDIIPPLPI